METYQLLRHDDRLSRDIVDKSDNTLNLPLSHRFKLTWKCQKCVRSWTESLTRRKRYDYCPDCQVRKNNNNQCLNEKCKKK